MRGQVRQVGGGVIGLAIATILVLNVTVPIIKDAVDGVSANLTGTEQTIADLVSLFAILGLMVGAAALFGLI